jgi:hypothetical protein
MTPSTLQTEFFTANGNDFTGATGLYPVVVRPPYASAWRLESIFYHKDTLTAVTITVSILIGGILYVLDTATALTTKDYIFPNSRVPYPIAMGEKASIVVSTSGLPACPHSIIVNWSQF